MTLQDKNNNAPSQATSKEKADPVSSHITACWFTEEQSAAESNVSFGIQGTGPLIALSELLPVLENMGARVISAHSFDTAERDNSQFTTHRHSWNILFKLQSNHYDLTDTEALQRNFKLLFMAIIRGEVENDGFNRLISIADISIQELVLLRAVSKYLLQINVPFSQSYIEEVLIQNNRIAELLIQLFNYKFKLSSGLAHAQRTDDIEKQQQLILTALDQVSKRDEDRILRSYLSVFNAMLRTNFYQPCRSSNYLKALSFKLKAKQIDGIPLPAPEFETFVYSPRVEGVHLRGGKVSRGGIRWSDRREDFRTEILGLVKAQMVKNSVIVPRIR